MEPESIKYTAFVTPGGQYEYLKMPFGLKNGPAVFQRFVTNIFRDMIEEGEIIIYIDDILIATNGVEENLRILKKLFERMVQWGLTVKLRKCHFLQKQVNFLGYCATEKGIRPNEDHLRGIARYPMPSDLKSLQACLGLFQ